MEPFKNSPDVCGTVRANTELLRHLLGPQRHLVSVIPEESLQVIFHRDQLEQVLFHLTLNARDALPNRGTLVISVRRIDGAVEVAFSDCDIGDEHETKEALLRPGFGRNGRNGAGFRLEIVRSTVGRWRGDVEFISSAEGSGIRIVLPLATHIQDHGVPSW
jgi:signal transduction histidine kinase